MCLLKSWFSNMLLNSMVDGLLAGVVELSRGRVGFPDV
jgi:hypothetical protein